MYIYKFWYIFISLWKKRSIFSVFYFVTMYKKLFHLHFPFWGAMVGYNVLLLYFSNGSLIGIASQIYFFLICKRCMLFPQQDPRILLSYEKKKILLSDTIYIVSCLFTSKGLLSFQSKLKRRNQTASCVSIDYLFISYSQSSKSWDIILLY